MDLKAYSVTKEGQLENTNRSEIHDFSFELNSTTHFHRNTGTVETGTIILL